MALSQYLVAASTPLEARAGVAAQLEEEWRVPGERAAEYSAKIEAALTMTEAEAVALRRRARRTRRSRREVGAGEDAGGRGAVHAIRAATYMSGGLATPHGSAAAFKRVSSAYAAVKDGRNVAFGKSAAADVNYGVYADEAELYRAVFAEGGGLTRLVGVLRANPWTLIALLSALQSLGNIASMIWRRPQALLRCVACVGTVYVAARRCKM